MKNKLKEIVEQCYECNIEQDQCVGLILSLISDTIKECLPAHTKECQRKNQELRDKFGVEFGEKCICEERNEIINKLKEVGLIL